jgi:hypothetical protein
MSWRFDATDVSAVFDSPSLWQRARPVFTGYDVPLVLAVGLLALAGLVTMYSPATTRGRASPTTAATWRSPSSSSSSPRRSRRSS